MEIDYRLFNADCLDVIKAIQPHANVDCVFADPPDNIGLNYNNHKDKIPDKEYVALLKKQIWKFIECASITWLSFNSKWILEVASEIKRLRTFIDLDWKACVQTFTFGQHNHHDLGNNHRPLWRFRWPEASLYPDQIRVPSARQVIYGDKRADPRGRVPGDVFDFPRVTGNSKQRRPWIPTQLHEGLVERCILLSTKPGDLVLDPFAGSGTALRVCKRIDRRCISVEIDPDYCKRIAEEHDLQIERLEND